MRIRLDSSFIFLVAALTVALYSMGLDGPFVHDDWPNLYPVLGWFAHQETFSNVLFGNNSGMLGRPISVLSFMLNSRLFGFEAFALKSVNLALHVLCAALVYLFVAAFRRQLAASPDKWLGLTIEAWVAGLWLLSPMHVSTVLYTVQRMTQLSTVFVLLGLITYLRVRGEFLANTLTGWGLYRALLWLPLFLVLGALSKESAALLPAFWLLLEIALGGDALRRAGPFRALFGLFLAVPLVVVIGYAVLSDGGFIARGYASRDFDLWGRLCAQVPILVDYLYRLINPLADRVFLFGDGFFPAGLALGDPRLWAAVAILGGLLLAALALHRRMPLILFGLLFFLVAHAMESSILPLDMYYEHRNYLASVGVLMSLLGILILLRDTLPHLGKLASTTVVLGLIVTSAYSLSGATQVWATQSSLAVYGVRHWPDSVRAQVMLSNTLLSKGEVDAAVAGMERFLDGKEGPRALRSAALGSVILSCQGTGGVSNAEGLAQNLGDLRVSVLDLQLVRRLMELSLDAQCDGWGPDETRDTIRELLRRDDAFVEEGGLASVVREKLEASYLRYETEKVHNVAVCEQARRHWARSRQFDAGVASYWCARARCLSSDMQQIESDIRQLHSSKANIEHQFFALFDASCEAAN